MKKMGSVIACILGGLERGLGRMIGSRDKENAVVIKREYVSLSTRVFGSRDLRTLNERLGYIIALSGANYNECAEKEIAETLSLLDRSGLSPRGIKKREGVGRSGLSEADLERRLRIWRGKVLYGLERYDEAEQVVRVVLKEYEDELGPDHGKIDLIRNHASVLSELGRHDEAIAKMVDVIARHTAKDGPVAATTLRSRTSYAMILFHADELMKAEKEARAVVMEATRVLGSHHAETLSAVDVHATTLYHLGRLPESVTEFESLADRCVAAFGVDDSRTRHARISLEHVYAELQEEWPDDGA